MRGSRVLLAMAGLALAASIAGVRTGAVMPPPLDPDTAVAAAYGDAAAADTNAALILFIARYPDHPLAQAARVRLLARTEPDPAPPEGPDGRIIARFDAARRDGSAEALDGFARRHAGHPLAVEARRSIWRR